MGNVPFARELSDVTSVCTTTGIGDTVARIMAVRAPSSLSVMISHTS
jgi:hypothetical protein